MIKRRLSELYAFIGEMFHELNQVMLRVVTTAKSPTLRYLGRAHRVSASWLHEAFQMKEITLVYEETARMCADMYTTGFLLIESSGSRTAI